MDSQTIILIGVAAYVVVMLAVGIIVAGKSVSMTDFAVSGRNMSLTVCSISIVATWFGSGPMWEPMAVTIMFGLLFATALTLIVIPYFYVLFMRIKAD